MSSVAKPGLVFFLVKNILDERQSDLSERRGDSSETVESIRTTRYWGTLQVQHDHKDFHLIR